MGALIDGRWTDRPRDSLAAAGRFERQDSHFRSWVTGDGEPGPTGVGGFKAQAGRYHLYVSLACPWAHRTLIMRQLKGLGDMVDVSVVHWRMLEQGWTFAPGPGVRRDPVHGAAFLHQIYSAADPGYTGRVTVPVLWDKVGATIVNNESSEIIRMLNSAFDAIGAAPGDFYPKSLRDEIDELNARIYETVNNGVYRAGFATSQDAYEDAVGPLFRTLDWLEERLGSRRFLCGERLTEADIRLYTTLARFDAVYFGHFKCNLRRIVDYRNLSNYLVHLFTMAAFSETTDIGHIKRHYYESQRSINPTGIVPVGPELSFMA